MLAQHEHEHTHTHRHIHTPTQIHSHRERKEGERERGREGEADRKTEKERESGLKDYLPQPILGHKVISLVVLMCREIHSHGMREHPHRAQYPKGGDGDARASPALLRTKIEC